MDQRYDLLKKIANAISDAPTMPEGVMEQEYDLIKRIYANLGNVTLRGIRGPVTAATDAPTSADDLIVYDTSATPIAVTLPTPVGRTGESLTLFWMAGANALTVTSASGTVLGSATYTMSVVGQAITVVSDGTNWIPG